MAERIYNRASNLYYAAPLEDGRYGIFTPSFLAAKPHWQFPQRFASREKAQAFLLRRLFHRSLVRWEARNQPLARPATGQPHLYWRP